MKRYRILSFDFDSRVYTLTQNIQDQWEDHVKQMHHENRRRILDGLAAQFGQFQFDQKVQNFLDIGVKPMSIVAYHNKFFEQARCAFVGGGYYPALTAACALGERILNHLMLLLRDDFRATPEYKRVYRKDSFDHWDLPINALTSWGVLLPDVAERFRDLARLRNRHAIHFNPDTEQNDRPLALEAIRQLTEIIKGQFIAFGPLPWCLMEIPGEIYIKKDAEAQPFVSKVYLPNCLLVGPYHAVENIGLDGRMHVRDDYPYEEREISDHEFARLRSQGPGTAAGPTS